MIIEFKRITEQRHSVTVQRTNGAEHSVTLNTKDFLRHDLAHFVVEAEFDLRGGVWGSVANGGSLGGDGLDGPDMELAERLAGPVQTLMRTGPDVDQIEATLRRVAPELATAEVADRLHRRIRAINGHWAATRFGDSMTLHWPPEPV